MAVLIGFLWNSLTLSDSAWLTLLCFIFNWTPTTIFSYLCLQCQTLSSPSLPLFPLPTPAPSTPLRPQPASVVPMASVCPPAPSSSSRQYSVTHLERCRHVSANTSTSSYWREDNLCLLLALLLCCHLQPALLCSPSPASHTQVQYTHSSFWRLEH